MIALITNYLEPIACLLYFIALVINYRIKKSTGLHILFVYYLFAILLLTAGAFRIGAKNNNNIWVYDLLLLFTSVLIGIYFYRLFRASAKKKIVLVLIGIYIIYAIIRNLTIAEIRLFDSLGYSLVSASVTVYVFMYFHQVLKNVTGVNILKEFDFWLASGYLFYFAGSFIIFVSYYYFTTKILATYTEEERDLLTALWGLHNVLLFISASSLLIGSLWLAYRRKSG